MLELWFKLENLRIGVGFSSVCIQEAPRTDKAKLPKKVNGVQDIDPQHIEQEPWVLGSLT